MASHAIDVLIRGAKVVDGTGNPWFYGDIAIQGEPPYVSAGESTENLANRDKIRDFGIYHLLHQRWDLFVPFFERNLQFLKPGTGKLALIVSKGIETEGYAERLRQLLIRQYKLLQIDFFPGLRLFQDAAVENTIVIVENHVPDAEHTVERRKHVQADCRHFEVLPLIRQLPANGQIFRWRYDAILDQNLTQGTIPLCAIVYIGTGVEAQSEEAADPVDKGRRQKLFTLDDVFLPPGAERPADYIDEGVLGNDIDRYYLRRKRFVAYEKYRPQMRRSRHIALFRTAEKLLLGETSGGYYDRFGLFANHSVQVVVSWNALHQAGATEEKGIKTVLRESRRMANVSGDLTHISAMFDLRYLLGIINSRFIRNYMASNRLEGTREGRIYPDVWKKLPIKVVSLTRQQQIAEKVDSIQALYQQLATLPTPVSLANSPAIPYKDAQGYLAQGTLRYAGDVQSTIVEKPTIQNGRLILRRQPQCYLEASEPELLRYLELYLTQINPVFQGWRWSEARKRIQVPATLDALRSFMSDVDSLAKEREKTRAIITTLSDEIEALVEAIYNAMPDTDMMTIIERERSDKASTSLFPLDAS